MMKGVKMEHEGEVLNPFVVLEEVEVVALSEVEALVL